MTAADTVLWSTGRAVVLATVAAMIWLPLRPKFASPGSSSRQLAVAILTPLFIPAVLVGYTYRLTSGYFEFSAVATELVYSSLLLAKLVAVQLVCEWLMPPSSVSWSAIHLWKQTAPRWSTIRLLFTGPWRATVVGACLGFLLCFQEFETASLMQIEQHPIAWEVWLFDAKTAGTPLSECLWHARHAVAVQSLVILACFALVKSAGSGRSLEFDEIPRAASRLSVVSCITVIACFLLVVVSPFLLHVTSGVKGVSGLIESGNFSRGIRQIGWSTSSAGLAAIGSWQLARFLFRKGSMFAIWLCVVPGLLSPLLLSLLLLALFQLPLVRSVYDSLLPLILGQILWLLPRAFLLCVAVDRLFPGESIFGATLLGKSFDARVQKNASVIRWRLEGRATWFSITALMLFAFWEVTTNSILHPVSMTPVVCRLYREMHWGHSETLMALAALALVLPLLIVGVLAAVRRWGVE